MDTSDQIKLFMDYICEDLEIPLPPIVIDESLKLSAAYTDGRIILKQYSADRETLLAIAHELRHAWQLATDEQRWFTGYMTREEAGDTNTYNAQPAEIDANAYASIIMMEMVLMKPIFHGYSEAVKAAIDARIEQILEGE